jgi:hypothetical protein
MNTEWPGLPDYTGPKTGWFTLLHHEGPHYEFSHDVAERIDYINEHKPAHERPIRLRHIRFVSEDAPPALAEYERVTATALAEYERVRAPAWAEYERVTATARERLDAEIRALIPDCRWNGATLVFA